MIQTISDPDAISFHRGRNISLYLLKNQIDRRILKITHMVNKLETKRSHTSRSHCKSRSQRHRLIQTEAIQSLKATQKLLSGVNNLDSLSLIKKDSLQQKRELIQIDENSHKITEADTSLTKKERSKKPESKYYQKQNFAAHLLPMVESNSFTFNAQKKQGADDGSLFQLHFLHEQVDELFQDDFQFQISNVQMCNSVIQEDLKDNRKTSMNNSDDFSNGIMSSAFIDLSKTTILKHETKHKRILTRKIKYPVRDIILPPIQSRVQVTDKCLLQMQGQVDFLISRRRKQAYDNKLRVNVLKSIQDKYKEERTN